MAVSCRLWVTLFLVTLKQHFLAAWVVISSMLKMTTKNKYRCFRSISLIEPYRIEFFTYRWTKISSRTSSLALQVKITIYRNDWREHRAFIAWANVQIYLWTFFLRFFYPRNEKHMLLIWAYWHTYFVIDANPYWFWYVAYLGLLSPTTVPI